MKISRLEILVSVDDEEMCNDFAKQRLQFVDTLFCTCFSLLYHLDWKLFIRVELIWFIVWEIDTLTYAKEWDEYGVYLKININESWNFEYNVDNCRNFRLFQSSLLLLF